MSEFQVTLRGGSRVERVANPADAEACGRAVGLGRPTITTDDGQAIAFLKRGVSFPVMLGALRVGAVFVVAIAVSGGVAIVQVLASRWWLAGIYVTSFTDPDGYRLDFESPTDVPEDTVYSDPK